MKRRSVLKTAAIAAACSVTFGISAFAANPVLKIGFVGVTSGPAASWGISNQRSMETRAAWINEIGGYTIGDTLIYAQDAQQRLFEDAAAYKNMNHFKVHFEVVFYFYEMGKNL